MADLRSAQRPQQGLELGRSRHGRGERYALVLGVRLVRLVWFVRFFELLGLRESSGLLDALDGSSATPSPSATTSKGDSSTKPDKKNSSGSGESTAETAKPSDTSPVVSTEEDEADKSWQEGSSSALVDVGALGSGKHRGDSAEENATKSTAASPAGRHAAATYVVQEGDSLASIADSLGLDGGWRALYAENKDRIGVDPSNIVAGQTLDTGAE